MSRASRPLRLVALLVSALLGLAVVGTAFPLSAEAASRPVVTAVGSGAGPLDPTVVVLKGSNLAGATSVKFGRKKAKILARVDATTLRVRTPKGIKAGTVSVRVKTKGGWSKKSRKATYTFVKRPKLSSLSISKGSFAGGDRITLTGKDLSRTQKVLFGDVAATVVSRASTKVVATTPVGVPGSARVRVVTPGGTSKTKTFSYVIPAPKQAKTLTPAAGAATPSDVEWVTGGTADDGTVQPWVVGLPSGASVPSIGDPFVLKPGQDVFPSGLAGTVSDVAVQADASVRVTVAPSDLNQTLQRLTLDYSGPVSFPGSTATGGRRKTETSRGTTFAFEGPTPISCNDENGAKVGFGIDLSTSVTDVDVSQHLDLGSLVRRPSFDGAMTAELQTEGKISVEAAATCKLKPAWQNAQRVKIPLGTTGLTLSFGPSLEMKFSAKGTYSFKDRTRTTFAVSYVYGKTPTYTRTSRNLESKQGGASSLSVDLTAGFSVQFGVLDRAGFEGKIQGGVSVTLTAENANVCVEGKLYAKLTIGVFLDAWVVRWEGEAFSATLDLAKVHGCVLPEGSAPAGEPEITSTRLSDATIGSPTTRA